MKMKRGVIVFAAIIMVTMTIPAVMGQPGVTDPTFNFAPIADAGGPYDGPAGSPIYFDGSGSFDPDEPFGEIVSYTWDFGDGNTGTGVSPTHTYASAGDYTVTLTVLDDCFDFDTATTTATISLSTTGSENNQPPVADAGGPYEVSEGSSVQLDGTGSSDPDGSITSYDWDFDGDGEFNDATGPNPTFSAASLDGPSIIDIRLRVTDDAGANDTGTTTATVNNVAPTVEAGADQTVDEGDLVTIGPTFTDAGSADTHTATIDWGDGSAVTNIDPATSPLSDTHTYADDGTYTVTVTVTDDDGGEGTDTASVTVNNVAPTISASVVVETIDENGVATVRGTIIDPGIQDTFTVVIDWGEGSPETITCLAGTTSFSATHQYLDDDPTGTSSDEYNIGVTVTDKDQGVGTASTKVTVNNVAPTVGPIEDAPVGPIQVGTVVVTVSADFTDPGMLDTHTATWDWGDGSITTVNLDQGARTVSDSHTYTEAGVYTVKLTVTDDDGGSDSAQYQQYIVVYDPDGGFVTGGGWITSPEGAYIPDPTLTGKATFGFVSKYKKGATVPTGQTEFQFHAGDLNFHSTSYDWLVIAGAKAKYKGTGAINGAGNYGFMLTAIDEKLTPSTDVDMFRIKIWNKDNGDTIVYDNQLGDDDDVDPATALGEGSIVIHKSK